MLLNCRAAKTKYIQYNMEIGDVHNQKGHKKHIQVNINIYIQVFKIGTNVKSSIFI